MKTLKLSIVALFITSLSFAQAVEAKKVAPKVPNTVATPAQTKASAMKWNTETHEFGEIEKGKPVSYEFTFTNTTKETILITNVKPSCGCTAANYTKTPIKPGEKGSITATYNAASPGNFTKTVTVTTSEEGAAPKVLIIKGSVKAEEKKEEKSVMFK
ncbi:DUF1573 domain-containing protein [Flavobacterium sp. TP390]|uniref:DUF1573 domain-containing protein n=1 Tax=Flavobacterium profundi TaxID=1774945 RepID=A0A6I4ITH8_9FLAO|nr:DUF1573 domain-containing protein [Flavobacterium profundi]MVO10145.1 DUF1573 domain-containing protein [Flavobacterium profundi]